MLKVNRWKIITHHAFKHKPRKSTWRQDLRISRLHGNGLHGSNHSTCSGHSTTWIVFRWCVYSFARSMASPEELCPNHWWTSRENLLSDTDFKNLLEFPPSLSNCLYDFTTPKFTVYLPEDLTTFPSSSTPHFLFPLTGLMGKGMRVWRGGPKNLLPGERFLVLQVLRDP